MKVLTAGGGSGGHVTPVLAVINELARHDASLEVQFICDKKFSGAARDLMSHARVSVPVYTIAAGKLRRYYGIPLWRQMLDIPTLLQNLRDGLLVTVGLVESLWRLFRFRPDVVFLKGGYVCLPVGLAASLLRLPIVLHDSDSHPGLTNRILSRWATKIATGAPAENYPYPAAKMRYVGIPVDGRYRPVSEKQQAAFKAHVGMPDTSWPLVVVTGGGLGARRINEAVSLLAQRFTEAGVAVLHITGQNGYDRVAAQAIQHPAYIVRPFISDGMFRAIGAADVVVTRAGATSLLEIAAMAKPTIIIPSKVLTGGHQMKNAAVYVNAEAAVEVDEDQLRGDPQVLYDAIMRFLNDPARADRYGKKMHSFAKPDAALDVAEIISGVAAGGSFGRVGE